MLRPAVVCTCLLILAALAVAEESREADLRAIRAQIERLQAELGRVSDRATGLAGKLEQTGLELQLQERRVAEAATAHDVARQRAATTEGRVAELEATLAEVQSELHQRLVALYRLGRQGYLRVFLSIEPGSELLPAIRQLRYLIQRDALALDRYLDTREELAKERDQLVREREEAEEWLGLQQSRRSELLRIQRREARLLAEAEQEREALEARAAELRDKERRLANLIDFLYRQDPSVDSGTPIHEFRGVLDWPVQGTVNVGFGPRLDPIYKTRIPHNGIEIGLEEGSEVRAVFPGKVLFAAPFEGYGFTAIVHHSGRVFTLYAGLSELLVHKEDVLSLGQIIGLADEKLYFEVRVRNQPEDPLFWLR